jgi:hypothetical protein
VRTRCSQSGGKPRTGHRPRPARDSWKGYVRLKDGRSDNHTPGAIQDRRAISGPLTAVRRGPSRSHHGEAASQVKPCRGPDCTDSQADSAGSIPVTRSRRVRAGWRAGAAARHDDRDLR